MVVIYACRLRPSVVEPKRFTTYCCFWFRPKFRGLLLVERLILDTEWNNSAFYRSYIQHIYSGDRVFSPSQNVQNVLIDFWLFSKKIICSVRYVLSWKTFIIYIFLLFFLTVLTQLINRINDKCKSAAIQLIILKCFGFLNCFYKHILAAEKKSFWQSNIFVYKKLLFWLIEHYIVLLYDNTTAMRFNCFTLVI